MLKLNNRVMKIDFRETLSCEYDSVIHTLKKAFPVDEFYYCGQMFCSTLDTNGEPFYKDITGEFKLIGAGLNKEHLKGVKGSPLIAIFTNAEEEELLFHIDDDGKWNNLTRKQA